MVKALDLQQASYILALLFPSILINWYSSYLDISPMKIKQILISLKKKMQLSAFKQTLGQLETLQFQLPNGQLVPAHFHITEVGHVTRNFIDCGGTLRQENKLNLQLWVASDTDHRLKPDSVLNILQLAEKQLEYADMEVEVEYQQNTVGRYRLAFDGSTFQLINTQTACLAPDHCGIPQEKPRVRVTASGVSCNPNAGCC